MKNEIRNVYTGLLNSIIKNDTSLLNDKQISIVKEHEPELKRLYQNIKREQRKNSFKRFIREIPEYILYFISCLMNWITIPFDYIYYKADDLRVNYANKHTRVDRLRAKEKLNDYCFEEVLPKLIEAEESNINENKRGTDND
ncbi:hypothetical protein [Staphylococcus coagulans]|uniref:hypothetical protein n=1 Tax=Staphylococcus coagulans TaxID=74706 RepID=UPI0015F8F47D|nr:hypothetical protein [Staphylococcus coagulans]MBA8761728.1 hypothetical protein [Staphylococcus coagulans]